MQQANSEDEVLTPAQVATVLQRLHERAALGPGHEPAGSLKLSELAAALGVDPAEVARLSAPTPARAEPILPRPWIYYLTAALALSVFAMQCVAFLRSTPPPAPSPVTWSSPGQLRGEALAQFDPYSGGYRRQLPFPFNPPQELIVDRSVTAPPAGIRITLITPVAQKAIAGSPGVIENQVVAADQLRESIKSLLAYEESQAKVTGELPVMDYAKAPLIPSQADFQGMPVYVGWHVVEVSNGLFNWRAVLPDRRYARDLAAFEAALSERLDLLTDKKIFDDLPPARLRPNSRLLKPKIPPPPGTALVMWDAERTVWADGGPATQPYGSSDEAQAAVREAVSSFTDEVRRQQPFAIAPSSKNGRIENVANFMLVYPGGEARYYWYLSDDPDFTPSWSYTQGSERVTRWLAEAAAAALTGSVRPVTIAHPRPPG